VSLDVLAPGARVPDLRAVLLAGDRALSLASSRLTVEAALRLAQLRPVIRTRERRESEEGGDGEVLAQQPAAGSVVAVGSEVTVELLDVPCIVPDVARAMARSSSLEEARARALV
jgi:hypothetical protein